MRIRQDFGGLFWVVEAVGVGEALEGDVGGDEEFLTEGVLEEVAGAAGGDQGGFRFAAFLEFGGDGVEEGLDHAAETDEAADFHGVAGGFSDRALDVEVVVQVGEEGGLFVEVLGHDAEAGSDDAAFVAAGGGDDVEGDGGSHVDDDAGEGEFRGGGDGVGEAVLADFGGARVADRHAELHVAGEVEEVLLEV